MKVLICLLIILVAISTSYGSGSGFLLPYPLENAPFYCTVVDNKLYINGLFDKELNETEVLEYNEYWAKLIGFKSKYVNFMKEQEKTNLGILDHNILQVDAPSPPLKPSFCQLTSKPFTFIGCVIQNDKIYVNKEPIRALTEDELEQLETFMKQVDDYEKQVQLVEHLNKIKYQNASPDVQEKATMAEGYMMIEKPIPPTPPRICPTFY